MAEQRLQIIEDNGHGWMATCFKCDACFGINSDQPLGMQDFTCQNCGDTIRTDLRDLECFSEEESFESYDDGGYEDAFGNNKHQALGQERC